MAVYNVVGYYNTGFGSGNVPDSPAVLRLATSKTFPSNWLLQNKDLVATRVNATWGEVENIDYVALGGAYYFVTNIAMLTEVCAELTLSLDGLTTAGGVSGLTITGGWCKRAHTGNDALFANIIPEPFQPAEDLQVNGFIQLSALSNTGQTFIASTVDLLNIEKLADEYADADGNIVCYVPAVPLPPSNANVVVPTTGGDKTCPVPNTMLYRFSEAGMGSPIEEALKQLRALGLETAITGAYVVPFQWLSGNEPGQPIAANVKGAGGQAPTNIPYIYGSARNNKVYALYNQYALVATATGNKTVYEGYELYNSDNSPQVYMGANPAPNGCPYAQFLYFNRRRTQPLESAVLGGTWLNTPIVYSNTSGSLIKQTQFSNRMELRTEALAQQFAGDAISGVLGLIGSVAGMSGGGSAAQGGQGGSGVGGLFSNNLGFVSLPERVELAGRQLDTEAAEFATSQAISVPDISFPQGVTTQMFTGNGFFVYRTCLSANDLARFDKFLTMFGYAQSKALEKSDFTNRRYFNFVQADGVTVGGNVGLRIRERIAAQLSGGVRIWHTLPNPSYYTNNPIA